MKSPPLQYTVSMVFLSKALHYMYMALVHRYRPLREVDVFFDEGPAGHRSRRVLIFEPPADKPLATIILLHGMTVRGVNDPRVWNISRAFGSIGYRVLVPEYPEISKLDIKRKSIEDMRKTMESLLISDLCPEGRAGIFSVSFSASMALVAASHPAIATKISSICAIGAGANVDNVVRFCMEHDNIDEYGMYILFRNFLHFIPEGQNPVFPEMFYQAACDNALRRDPPILPEMIQKLKKKDRTFFQNLLTDREFRIKTWNRIRANPEVMTVLNTFHAYSAVAGLLAPVSFLHGESDNVIPPTESRMMQKRLRRLGIPVRLAVTPLLTHGDPAVNPRTLFHLFYLASRFGFFFKHLEKG